MHVYSISIFPEAEISQSLLLLVVHDVILFNIYFLLSSVLWVDSSNLLHLLVYAVLSVLFGSIINKIMFSQERGQFGVCSFV